MGIPWHPFNWHLGWLLVLLSFVTGALIGLGFHREAFLGGYQSFARRLLRLGHIALAALGMMNVLFSISPWPPPGTWLASSASACFALGAVTMPAVCFLTAWRGGFRHLFAVPVVTLLLAVVFTWLGGTS
jgi:hypothetical protein